MRKVRGAPQAHFACDQNGQLLGEYNKSGGALQEVVRLGGTLVPFLETRAIQFAHLATA